MKLMHLSDLHIGKKVNEMSMIDEQRFVLNQICDIAKVQMPDAVLISGDVYDKANPSSEAMTLFSSFLFELSKGGKPVFVISGNHDSAERISYMNSLLTSADIYMSPVYDGKIRPMVMEDEFGPVNFYLLPFIKPATVRHYMDEGEREKIDSYDEAVKFVVGGMDVDTSERNVLLAHQFITAAERTESEDLSVGGLDNVDVSSFDCFDYVALGHLHRPQYCGRPEVRYCGSPLKYSFSEVDDSKSVTIVELHEKGRVEIDTVPLVPCHDWYDVRGSYDEVTSRDFYLGKALQDGFVRMTLTDEDDVPDAVCKLRTIYHNIMELRYDNKRTRAGSVDIGGAEGVEDKSPQELFDELFFKQNERHLNDVQSRFLDSIVEKIMDENR